MKADLSTLIAETLAKAVDLLLSWCPLTSYLKMDYERGSLEISSAGEKAFASWDGPALS